MLQGVKADGIVELDGKEYFLTHPTIEDIKLIDLWIRKQIIDLAKAAIDENTSEEMARIIMSVGIAYASTVSFLSDRGAELLNTIFGWARLMWTSLRHKHPNLEYEQVVKMFVNPENLIRAREAWQAMHETGGDSKSPKVEEPQVPLKESGTTSTEG